MSPGKHTRVEQWAASGAPPAGAPGGDAMVQATASGPMAPPPALRSDWGRGIFGNRAAAHAPVPDGEPDGGSTAHDGDPAGGRLPADVRADAERSFGESFADVRIESGSDLPGRGALAATAGTAIRFAPGRYQPHSTEGRQLLGHELAHVVQQRRGITPATQFKRGGFAIDSALEAEADAAGERFAHGAQVQLGAAPSVVPAVAAPRSGALAPPPGPAALAGGPGQIEQPALEPPPNGHKGPETPMLEKWLKTYLRPQMDVRFALEEFFTNSEYETMLELLFAIDCSDPGLAYKQMLRIVEWVNGIEDAAPSNTNDSSSKRTPSNTNADARGGRGKKPRKHNRRGNKQSVLEKEDNEKEKGNEKEKRDESEKDDDNDREIEPERDRVRGQGRRRGKKNEQEPPRDNAPGPKVLSDATATYSVNPGEQVMGDAYHLGAALALAPNTRAAFAPMPGGTDDTAKAKQKKYGSRNAPFHSLLSAAVGPDGQGRVQDTPTPDVVPAGRASLVVSDAYKKDPEQARDQVRHAFLDGLAPEVKELIEMYVRLKASAAGLQPVPHGQKVDRSQLKILVWCRAKDASENTGVPRNTGELLRTLCDLVKQAGMLPVVTGEAELDHKDQPLRVRGADLREHWKNPVFAGKSDTYQRQLYMFDVLMREFGCIGQLGVKSGALDGPALIGLPTCVIDLEDPSSDRATRMARWGRDIPWYHVFYPRTKVPLNREPQPEKQRVDGLEVVNGATGPRQRSEKASRHELVRSQEVQGLYTRIVQRLGEFADLATAKIETSNVPPPQAMQADPLLGNGEFVHQLARAKELLAIAEQADPRKTHPLTVELHDIWRDIVQLIQ